MASKDATPLSNSASHPAAAHGRFVPKQVIGSPEMGEYTRFSPLLLEERLCILGPHSIVNINVPTKLIIHISKEIKPTSHSQKDTILIN